MPSNPFARIYHFILYVYLYIQTCLLMATSTLEERNAGTNQSGF